MACASTSYMTNLSQAAEHSNDAHGSYTSPISFAEDWRQGMGYSVHYDGLWEPEEFQVPEIKVHVASINF